MKIKREIAFEIWEAYFGINTDCTEDAFGTMICKENYAENSSDSWDIDHIWPLNPDDKYIEGANVYENVQPLSTKNNNLKSNNLQGKTNNITYAVSKVGTYEGKNIGRLAIRVDDAWVWPYKEPYYD